MVSAETAWQLHTRAVRPAPAATGWCRTETGQDRGSDPRWRASPILAVATRPERPARPKEVS